MLKTEATRRAAIILGVAACLLAGTPAAVESDDRELLRTRIGKPYIFILLDNSASMTLDPDNNWVPGNGDDPRSKFYQAKEALYEVFSNVSDVSVGFATFNQNQTRVLAKHWLYRTGGTTGNDLGYPSAGDLLTFGTHFDLDTPGVAGSCDAPLSLASERDKINRFAKLGHSADEMTTIWVVDSGTTYRLQWEEGFDLPMGSFLRIDILRLDRVATCSPLVFDKNQSTFVGLEARNQFLMRDLAVELVVEDNAPGNSGGGSTTITSNEPEGGFWTWEDVLTDASCDSGGPFSGDGWEGNYDSGVVTGDADFDAGVTDVDPFCTDRPGNSDICRNLHVATTVNGVGRALDRGDMLPLDWSTDNIDEFLSRLAPNHPDGGLPDFRAAPYFHDAPDPQTGTLELRNQNRKPLFAAGGDSKLGDAISDFRCWYRGQSVGGKCRDIGPEDGWVELAEDQDPDFNCRRPYLIVVGDGENTCAGENPCADTANLNAQEGMRSWVLTYGTNAQPPLSCIASNGGGELVFVNNKDSLVAELNEILGEIREDTRAFASAAAPSVQAIVENKVFISTFTPVASNATWDGHIDAFLKPLPLDLDGRPDRDSPNHLWDAGEVVRDNQAPTQGEADSGTLMLGAAAGERRVFYAREVKADGTPTEPGEWPGTRRLLEWTDDNTDPDIRYDLWNAFDLPFAPDTTDEPPVIDTTAQDRANQVIANTLAIKEATINAGTAQEEEITYVLGDIFHADPLVLGSPTNTRLFAENTGDDGSECADGNPGYRCFFRKHQFRRKVLVVGSNDGMFHGFDAGTPDGSVVDGELEVNFDNGTGHELFAFMPRRVMPTVKRLAEGSVHQFAVDGPPTIGDVFIDPVYTSVGPVATDREWRTVAVGGLREGGTGYYAVDMTQPDTLDANGVPQPANDYVPSCLGSPVGLDPIVDPSSCGPLPYPSPLWQFTDSVLDFTEVLDPGDRPRILALDEDSPDPDDPVAEGNGGADLADSWSPPTLGRIRLCVGAECDPTELDNDIIDRWVTVFGGGMDTGNKLFDPRTAPDESLPPLRGNWVYMVDVETGQAIYKRQVAGSVPGGVAAVDTDQDGYLDRLYFGTTAGYIYRADLGLDSSGNVPSLEAWAATVAGGDEGETFTVQRIPHFDGGSIPLWNPEIIFSANFDGTTATVKPRPIYQEPQVIFVARLGLYGLAFGTGDREDLWSTGPQEGRFYLFVDDTETLPAEEVPLNEADLARVNVNDAATNQDFLIARSAGQRGWYLALDVDERVITEAFALAGVTFFSSYKPQRPDDEDAEDPGNGGPGNGGPGNGGPGNGGPGNQEEFCARGGDSRIFVVNTTNANALLTDEYNVRQRSLVRNTFVTQPYTETGVNKNTSGDGGGGGGGGGDDGPDADELTAQLQAVMDEIKKLFPAECKFANYRVDIKTITSETGVVFIAPVPVCLMERNWKEF